jgi:hypothetical protein
MMVRELTAQLGIVHSTIHETILILFWKYVCCLVLCLLMGSQLLKRCAVEGDVFLLNTMVSDEGRSCHFNPERK